MTPPEESPGRAGPNRLLLAASAVAFAVVLAVNLPAFLRTALDCDPILFDLFIRESGRGAVMYRDMVENKPPGMFAWQAAARAVSGPTTEGIRLVDLLVVGAAAALLACWTHRGRPDLRAFTFALLATFYL